MIHQSFQICADVAVARLPEGVPKYMLDHLTGCMMVHEAWRRHGIGAQLLEQAERWSAAHGATELRLETWEFPTGPQPFYERRGYTTLRRMLVRPL